ncbi:MAG TPA: methyl-accepting chemotaxis protein, partial [Allocoleopsis sp.]
DPQSQSVLGVVKATLPVSPFPQRFETWQATTAFDVWQNMLSVYWVDTQTGTVIAATSDTTQQDKTLNSAIQQIAVALVAEGGKGADVATLKQSLLDRPASAQLQIGTLIQNDATGLSATLTDAQRRYTLTTVPGTAWVTIASVPLNAQNFDAATWLLIALLLGSAAGLAIFLMSRFASQLSIALNCLSHAAQQLIEGNFTGVMPLGKIQEVQTLTQSLNQLAEQLDIAAKYQLHTTQQIALLTEMAHGQVSTSAEMQHLFETTLTKARHLLSADRLVVYRLIDVENSDVVCASTAEGWIVLQPDPRDVLLIPQTYLKRCKRNDVVALTDVTQTDLSTDYQEWLSYLQVRAELLVPIVHHNELYGVLAVHHCATPHSWQAAEIQFAQQLALQWGRTLDRITLMQTYKSEIARSQLLQEMMLQLTQATTETAIWANFPLAHLRQVLQVDRILLYRLTGSGQEGEVVLESLLDGVPRALGAKNIYEPDTIRTLTAHNLTAHNLTAHNLTAPHKVSKKTIDEHAKRGQVQATADIYQARLKASQLHQLEQLAVRADLVAPILQGEEVLALLIAHHCATPRYWQPVEVELFAHVVTHVSFALDRCKLLEQGESTVAEAKRLAAEQQQQKEALQQQLMALIEQVEAAAKGNLTVRAVVADSAIGLVADFFNVIIESLQGIVTQVQQVALQVSGAIQADDLAVRQLAQLALAQTEEVNSSIAAIQHTLASIQSVAESAKQAVEFTHTASTKARVSGMAMDDMVQNILNLRDAIGTTAKKVKRLGESSQQISRAVALIEKVALQTNVLAINAGIEASRVGETGQGVAAVAEEIGNLAIQAATATKEIRELVQLIQGGTSEVVEAMEQSTAQVIEGTQLVEAAQLNLAETLQVFDQIDQLVKLIANAAKSQTETFYSITNMMRKIAISAERTSSSSHTVSQSLQQTVEIAETLQTSVKTFQV